MATGAAERGVLLTTYAVLLAVGALSGAIESFLVPQRLFGGIEGLSAVLALLGNVALGSFGAVGTRTMNGALAPALGWFLAVAVILLVAPGGDVVIPGGLPTDPGVVDAGVAFLVTGILGAGIGPIVAVRYTGRAPTPTPSV